MTAYADYFYYSEVYGGTEIPETDFRRLSRQASAKLNALTFGRLTSVTDDAALGLAREACCAVAELLYKDEQGGELASASNDGYSETYHASGRSTAQKVSETVKTYFSDTGLLYAGVCGRCCGC